MGNQSSQPMAGDFPQQLGQYMDLSQADMPSSQTSLPTQLPSSPYVDTLETPRVEKAPKKKTPKKRPREEAESVSAAGTFTSEHDLAATASQSLAEMGVQEPSTPPKKKRRKKKNKVVDDAHVDPALTAAEAVETIAGDGALGVSGAGMKLLTPPATQVPAVQVPATQASDPTSSLDNLANAAALASPRPKKMPSSPTVRKEPAKPVERKEPKEKTKKACTVAPKVSASESTIPDEPTEPPSPKKSHTFTASDIHAIDYFIDNVYIPRQNITKEQVCDMIQTKTAATVLDKEAIAALWKEIFLVLPHRTQRSIRRHCRRRYHNFLKGPWTIAEEEQLAQLYEAQPNKWSHISEVLGRSDEDCRDRWRNYVSLRDTQKKDRWDDDEQAKLVAAINEGAEASREQALAKAAEEGIEFEERDWTKTVNWDVVSQKLDRQRSRLQCLQKWHKMQRTKVNKARREADKSTPKPKAAKSPSKESGVREQKQSTSDDRSTKQEPPSTPAQTPPEPWMLTTPATNITEPNSSALQSMAAAASSGIGIEDKNNMFDPSNLPNGNELEAQKKKKKKKRKKTVLSAETVTDDDT